MIVQSHRCGYIYRGKIRSACRKGKDVSAHLERVEKGKGFPSEISEWVGYPDVGYHDVDLNHFVAINIGDGSISFYSDYLCQVVILYPPPPATN